MSHISVLGSGAWGIALATKLAVNHAKIIIWGRNTKTIDAINQHHHPAHPDIQFSANIQATTDIAFATAKAKAILLCVPSSAFIEVLHKISQPPFFFAWATKGFSAQGKLFSEEIRNHFNIGGAFITGPSFATDVVKNKPTAILVAGDDEQSVFWKESLHTQYFRPYTSRDILGAQVGAALKNIIAIAAGICDGCGFGANTQAAVITRGLKEINRLSTFWGGERDTVYGLSGLGDIVLTSTSDLSRNRRYGVSLTQQTNFNQLVEGKKAVAIVYQMMQDTQIELPICEAVYQITHKQASPTETVQKLLQRKLKSE